MSSIEIPPFNRQNLREYTIGAAARLVPLRNPNSYADNAVRRAIDLTADAFNDSEKLPADRLRTDVAKFCAHIALHEIIDQRRSFRGVGESQPELPITISMIPESSRHRRTPQLGRGDPWVTSTLQ